MSLAAGRLTLSRAGHALVASPPPPPWRALSIAQKWNAVLGDIERLGGSPARAALDRADARLIAEAGAALHDVLVRAARWLAPRRGMPLKQELSLLRRQLSALRHWSGPEAPALAPGETSALAELLRTLEERAESFRFPRSLSTADVSAIRAIARTLPYRSDPASDGSRELLEEALEAYEEARGSRTPAESEARVEERALARRLRVSAALEYFAPRPAFARDLLLDREIQDVYFSQVVRDDLDPALFFEHPAAAEFLRRTTLDKCVASAGDRIESDEQGSPCVRLEGERVPLGALMADGEFCLLMDPYFEQADRPGFAYVRGRGLWRFNPHLWATRDDGERRWKPIPLEPGEEWWRALRPHRVEHRRLSPRSDSPYAIRFIVSHESDRAQFRGTHSCLEMLIPERDEATQEWIRNLAGEVRFGVYPFGILPSPEYPVRIFRLTNFEVQYPDLSVNYRHRHKTTAEATLTEREFRGAMAEIRRIRLNGRRFEERSPVIDEHTRFSMARENCTWFVKQVASAGGQAIPVQLRALDQFPPPFFRLLAGWLFSSVHRRQAAMRLFGLVGEGDLTAGSLVTSPYVLRRYLQLRSETAALRFEAARTRTPPGPASSVSPGVAPT